VKRCRPGLSPICAAPLPAAQISRQQQERPGGNGDIRDVENARTQRADAYQDESFRDAHAMPSDESSQWSEKGNFATVSYSVEPTPATNGSHVSVNIHSLLVNYLPFFAGVPLVK
jgi:hypothetical protein